MPDNYLEHALEYARDKFRADPSTMTALYRCAYTGLYRRAAVRAWFAKVIDDQMLLKVLHEIRDREEG